MHYPLLSLITEYPNLLIIGKIIILAGILLIAHYLLFVTGRQFANTKPFIFNFLRDAFRITQILLLLLATRITLSSAPLFPRKLPFLTIGVDISIAITITFLALRGVRSISNTVIANHPFDISDNLQARAIVTQTRVLQRSLYFLIILLGAAFIFFSLPGTKELGKSFLASAGIASLIVGIAARPVLSNFIAGLQLAFTQPIRLDDSLIIDGEWGTVEKITATYVVLKIWDERRMIIPLQWFIENNFQNWTYDGSNIITTAYLYLDFSAPLQPIREKFQQLCCDSELWDKRTCNFQVTDFNEKTMQIRLLVSTNNSANAFNLRCLIREELIKFIAVTYPTALPKIRYQDNHPPSG